MHYLVFNFNNNNYNNNIFISYIKYTNITPPANSKANRGRWCVDSLRFITFWPKFILEVWLTKVVVAS